MVAVLVESELNVPLGCCVAADVPFMKCCRHRYTAESCSALPGSKNTAKAMGQIKLMVCGWVSVYPCQCVCVRVLARVDVCMCVWGEGYACMYAYMYVWACVGVFG